MPTILTLHTMGMAVLVGASWVLDLRLLGMSRHIPLSAFGWVFPAVAVGLAVNLITGLMLFTKSATTWATAVPFLLKMGFVVVSVATVLPLRSYVVGGGNGRPRSAVPNPESPDGHQAPIPGPVASAAAGRARRLAIVSIFAWAAAVTAGRLLAYIQP